MKLVVIAFLLALAQPAAACGVAVFGSSSSSEPAEPPPPPGPSGYEIATKLIGGLLVTSVLARWVVAQRRSAFA